MKIRCCPNCGRKYNIQEFYKKSLGLQRKCDKCNATLSYSMVRRVILVPIALLPILLSKYLTVFMCENSGISKGYVTLILIVLFILWYLFVLSFQTFKVVSNK